MSYDMNRSGKEGRGRKIGRNGREIEKGGKDRETEGVREGESGKEMDTAKE